MGFPLYWPRQRNGLARRRSAIAAVVFALAIVGQALVMR